MSNWKVLYADSNEIRRLRRQAKKKIENSQKNEKGGNKPVMGKPQKNMWVDLSTNLCIGGMRRLYFLRFFVFLPPRLDIFLFLPTLLPFFIFFVNKARFKKSSHEI